MEWTGEGIGNQRMEHEVAGWMFECGCVKDRTIVFGLGLCLGLRGVGRGGVGWFVDMGGCDGVEGALYPLHFRRYIRLSLARLVKEAKFSQRVGLHSSMSTQSIGDEITACQSQYPLIENI